MLRVSRLALVFFFVAAATSVHAGPAQDLATLCDDYWEGHLKANPRSATAMGDHRWDDRWEDISPAGVAANKARLTAVLERAKKIPDAGMSAADRLTRSA